MEGLIQPLFVALAVTVVSAIVLTHFGIQWGIRYRLMAVPNQRRRHERSVPYVGGLCVFTSLCLGLVTFSIQMPHWFLQNRASIWPVALSVVILMVVGFWDDLYELGAYPKLGVQLVAALILILFEPKVHALLSHWEGKLGVVIWSLGVVWILGITNSINLIDGLDGLASGMSILAGSSIFIFSIWVGQYAQFSIVVLALLIASLFVFFAFNWHPARAFLGDSGSLPVGFVLAATTLMVYAQSRTWVMILSMILMFGYPLLDMGICVMKRYRNRLPLFKGDRAHLHFRLLRLGLTTPKTAVLLLMIGLYLQISALSVNLMSPASAALGLTLVFFSVFSLIFVIGSIENWKVQRAFSAVTGIKTDRQDHGRGTEYLLSIDLSPILESNVSKHQVRKMIQALEFLIDQLIRKHDVVYLRDRKMLVWFHGLEKHPDVAEGVFLRIQSKVAEFLKLYNIESTSANLPMEFKQRQ